MTWPIYPPDLLQHHAANLPDLDGVKRYNDRVQGKTLKGKPGLYRCAADVWTRDLQTDVIKVIWRSYDKAKSESFHTWAERTFPGVDSPPDDSVWAVSGIVNIDNWPVPVLPDALSERMSIQAVCDTMQALLAIGQLPGRPIGMTTVPKPNTIEQRNVRAQLPFKVIVAETMGVAVRCVIQRVEQGEEVEPATYSKWSALMTSTEAHDTEERHVTFDVEEMDDDKTQLRAAVRAAKAALGLTGKPAARHWPSTPQLVWKLVHEPKQFELERVSE